MEAAVAQPWVPQQGTHSLSVVQSEAAEQGEEPGAPLPPPAAQTHPYTLQVF